MQDRVPQASIARDVLGGINAAMISLPQSIGLGIVAFAPLGPAFAANGALAGLLGAAYVGFLIPLFGGNRVIISGPRVASVLIVASVMGHALAPGAALEGRQAAAFALAFVMLLLAGGFEFVFGVLRFGGLIKYIPYPVVGGLLTGAAILIIWGQVRTLLGMPPGVSAFDALRAGVHPSLPMVLVAGVTAAVALAISRLVPRLPGILLALAAGITLYHALLPFLDEPALGGTVGAPGGFGTVFSLPLVSLWQDLRSGPLLSLPIVVTVVMGALSIAALASLETLLTALAVDGMTLERTNGNRELAAHGIANAIAAAAGGLVNAGRLSTTRFSYAAGARTWRASFTNGAIIVVVAIVFPGALAYLPHGVVAGILVVVGIEIVDRWTVAQVRNLAVSRWRGNPGDFAEIGVVLVVIVAAMAVGLVAALGLGTLIAVALLVARLRRTLIRRVYRGTHIHSRRQCSRESMEFLAREGHRIAVIELEGPVFFGGADQLEAEVERLTAEDVRFVVLDMKRVTEIDASGARTLENLFRRASRAGVYAALSYVAPERRRRGSNYQGHDRRSRGRRRNVWLMLEQFGVIRTVREDGIFPDTDTALGACENRLLAGAGEGAGQGGLDRQALGSMFDGLMRDEIRMLRRLAERRTYRSGEAIFREGDRGDAIYLLTRGTADVVIRVQGSEQGKRVETLTSGSVFGEIAVLDEKPRTASILAVGDVACYRMAATAFAEMKERHPRLALKILSKLCLTTSGRVRAANLMINELES